MWAAEALRGRSGHRLRWARPRRAREAHSARSSGTVAVARRRGVGPQCVLRAHQGARDFRVDHGPALDELLTQILAVLMERKLIELTRVSQDGCGAGRNSFRRKKKLKHYLH